MLDKLKALMDVQKKMQEMKRELEGTIFEVSSSDGLVKIKMNGSQEVQEIILQDEVQKIEKSRLQNSIKDAYNKAIKHSHDIAAQKMKDITGLNLPGLI